MTLYAFSILYLYIYLDPSTWEGQACFYFSEWERVWEHKGLESSLDIYISELVFMVRRSLWFMTLDGAHREIAAYIGSFFTESDRSSIVRTALSIWKVYSLSFKLVPVTCLTKHIPYDELWKLHKYCEGWAFKVPGKRWRMVRVWALSSTCTVEGTGKL